MICVKLCNGKTPQDLRDFSIPSSGVHKNNLFETLKQDLHGIFTEYVHIYENHKIEYEYDIKIFTDKIIKSNEEVNDNMKTASGKKIIYSIDLQEIVERFQTYSLDAFRTNIMKLIDSLKEKVNHKNFNL